MKNQLISEVSVQFKGVCPIADPNFEKTLDEWVGKDEIVAFKVNKESHNILVVTNSQNKLKPGVYTVLRIFPGGTNWHVSVDLSDASADKAMQKLMDYIGE